MTVQFCGEGRAESSPLSPFAERGEKMKLNADIIFQRLSQSYPVELYGSKNPKLLLSRPELYMDNELDFLSDHLYVATVEHLPRRPHLEKNVSLVCIGDSARLTYYKEHATVLLIPAKHSFFEVYKTLQQVFDVFEHWEKELFQIFLGDTDVNDIIACSQAVFKKPLILLDACFRLVSTPAEEEREHWPLTGSSLSQNSIGMYLSEMDLNMDKRGAMLLRFAEGSWLCVNIFDKKDEYAGCLVIDCSEHKYTDGEDVLAEYLASMIEKAYIKNPAFVDNNQTALKETLQRLLQDLPIGSGQRLLFNASNFTDKYVCISMHHTNQLPALPVNYICSVFEHSFLNSIAFEHNNAILALTNVSCMKDVHGEYRRMLGDKLGMFLSDMHLTAGISKGFEDLNEIKIRYLQAEAAIENGLLTDRDASVFFFDEYVLSEMIVNSLGGMPVEAYFPDGLEKLIEHDKSSDISYLETLKVFFDENLSYTKTASILYVHRSTLIDRIARIEKELKMNFKDAKQRLHLQLILNALYLEERMKKR